MKDVTSDLIGQRNVRIQKINKLKELGINPYPGKSYRKNSIGDIIFNFEKYDGKETCLTGRIMAWREHGKLVFGDIRDLSGILQIMIRKDDLKEDIKKGYLGWEHLSLLDLSDFIEVDGTIGKSKTGQITIKVTQIRLLSKAIRPIPRKLKNKEQKFRRRYLDMVIHPEVIKLFERKAKFWRVQREFLHQKGFLEVEVPIMESIPGGADAKPFVTHHNALGKDFFLRISTELYQKRLIGAGFEKIYTFGPHFRNEGIDDEHLQEFYDIEWYWAYADYKDNMKLVRELFLEIANEVYGKTEFTTRGHTFDLADEWKEIDYTDAIKDKYGIDIFEDSDKRISEVIKKNNIEMTGEKNRNRMIDTLWKSIRTEISGPAFLVNHPKFMSPLAKSQENDERLTERFQVIIAGSELGNGYTEINDPRDQLERFLEQQKLREEGDDEAHMLDIDFVEMLEYGMPPVSGYGQSERVFWFMEDITAREGTFFPQMRNEIENSTKEIYKGKVKFEEEKEDKK